MIPLPAIFFLCVCHRRVTRKFVLDKLKPLMVTEHYATSFTKSFLLSFSINKLHLKGRVKIRYIIKSLLKQKLGKSALLLNDHNSLVAHKQALLSLTEEVSCYKSCYRED